MSPKNPSTHKKRAFISILVVCFVLTMLMVNWIGKPLTTASAQDMVLLYQEDFDDGIAQGWTFPPSPEGEWWGEWWVDDGFLNATGHAWAEYQQVDWGVGQYLYEFDLVLDEVGIGVDFQVSNVGYYRVEFRRIDKGNLSISLQKIIWHESVTDLASDQSQTVPYPAGQNYHVIISFGDGKITFIPMLISSHLLPHIMVQDPDPLPPGGIAFEAYKNSLVRIDNLEVYGPQPTPTSTATSSRTPTSSPTSTNSPTSTITPSPSFTPTKTETPTSTQVIGILPSLPDLRIEAITAGPFDKNEHTQLLHVSFSNVGGVTADENHLRIVERCEGKESYYYALESLPAGEEKTVLVKLDIPDRLLGKTCRFEAEVDPDDEVKESNEGNNHLVSAPITFTKPANYIVIVGGTLVGVAISILLAGWISGRRAWRRKEQASRPEAPPPPPPIKGELVPRYANAVLLDQANDTQIDRHKPIEPGRSIRLRLDIGEYSPISAVVRPEPLPEHLLPRDIWLDVMVSSSDFKIKKNIYETLSSTTAQGRFFLPGDGGPARMEDGDFFMYFNLVAPTTPMSANARIGYYYRNHLVQSQLLTADIGGAKGGYRIDIDFSLTNSLLDIADLPARQQISILTNSNNGGHQIVVRPGNVEGRIINQACTYHLKEEKVDRIVSELREVLRSRIAPAKEKRRSKKELETDLRLLAPLGQNLWDETVAQCIRDIYPSLKTNEPVVIQISRPTTADYTFPWSFIYDIPIYEEDPNKLKLCPLVEKWDDQNYQLIALGSRRCPEATGPNGSHESDTLCPFGFWGYQYDVEQLSSSETPEMNISVPGNAVFPFPAILTQYDIKLNELSNHILAMKEVIKQHFQGVDLKEGKDLPTIRQIMGQDAPFIYFFCHGERGEYGDPDTYLGVGNYEKFRAKDFRKWVKEWDWNDNRTVWDKVRPLIFINACHALEIQNKTLVSYLDAFITNSHAAGVIGPEVKVKTSVAMDIGLEFSRLFFSGKSVGETMHLLRTDYLADGNLYGLIYTPYCWSDLTIKKV